MKPVNEVARELFDRLPVLPDMDGEHEDPEAAAVDLLAAALAEREAQVWEAAAQLAARVADEWRRDGNAGEAALGATEVWCELAAKAKEARNAKR
jgi:hypothetical protein